jgi:hypothetical protein
MYFRRKFAQTLKKMYSMQNSICLPVLIRFVIIVVLMGQMSIGVVSGADLHVPSQYRTIQQAIDAAEDGDRVIVASGLYSGRGFRGISFEGKAITVEGASAETTILDCEWMDRGFEFHCGEGPDSILRNMQIINGIDACGT